MKVMLPLISFILLLICGSSNRPILKISTAINNNKVIWADTLHLKLKNQIENENIQFYLNEKPINKNHVFTNEPLGVQIIKAIITNDNHTVALTQWAYVVEVNGCCADGADAVLGYEFFVV